MKNSNPIDRFEQELRRMIGRSAKSAEYEERIQEISGHFSDLYHEGMSQGLSEKDAERAARQRLGTPSQIASQMLVSPDRTIKGLRLQRFACYGYIGGVLANQAIPYCLVRHWQGIPLTVFAIISIAFCLCQGPIFGVGVMLAGRVSWKPALAIWPSAIVILATSTFLMTPLYESYRPGGVGKVLLSPNFYWTYALESSTRLMVFFVSLAVIAFIVARIGLLGRRWFRLERSR